MKKFRTTVSVIIMILAGIAGFFERSCADAGAAEYGSDPHQPRARSCPQAAGKHHLPDRAGCQVHSRVVAGLLSPALGQDLRRGFMA